MLLTVALCVLSVSAYADAENFMLHPSGTGCVLSHSAWVYYTKADGSPNSRLVEKDSIGKLYKDLYSDDFWAYINVVDRNGNYRIPSGKIGASALYFFPDHV